jgi:hypothetical protein
MPCENLTWGQMNRSNIDSHLVPELLEGHAAER